MVTGETTRGEDRHRALARFQAGWRYTERDGSVVEAVAPEAVALDLRQGYRTDQSVPPVWSRISMPAATTTSRMSSASAQRLSARAVRRRLRRAST
jgi:hypothetical protein